MTRMTCSNSVTRDVLRGALVLVLGAVLGSAACAQPENDPPSFEPEAGAGGAKDSGTDTALTGGASGEGGEGGEAGESGGGGAGSGGKAGSSGSAGKGGSGGVSGWGNGGTGGEDAGVPCGTLFCGAIKCQSNTTPPVDVTMEGCCKEEDVCGFVVMSVNCKMAEEVAGLGFTCEPKP